MKEKDIIQMEKEKFKINLFDLDMSHTILLLQSTNKLDSRTYSDYESVDECLDGKSLDKKNLLLFLFSRNL
jgi:hypothetical protein